MQLDPGHIGHMDVCNHAGRMNNVWGCEEIRGGSKFLDFEA